LNRNVRIALWVALLAASAQYLVAQQSTAAAALTAEQELIRRLPDDWRVTALRYHVFSDFDSGIAASTEVAAEEIRLLALRRLAGIYGAEEFVARHLEDELENVRASGHQTPEARRRDILTAVLRNLGGRQNWINNPLTLPLLEKEAYTDPDPRVSSAALEALHHLEVRRLLAAVEARLTRVGDDYNNHKDEVDRLENEQDQLFYERDGIDLPAVMRVPPPVFQISPKTSSIRVAMMGDFGTRGEDQHKVAAAMVREHQKKPFDFGLTLGDNFYLDLTSPDDPQFKTAFEDLYGPMGITFYPSFGNHDWGGELPAIEIAYSQKNSHWNLPAPYYTYTAGPVQFFVVNTEFQFDRPEGLSAGVAPVQLRWLQAELEKSKATWKVVYGHVPTYTSLYSDNGPMTGLMETMKGRADFYISGHVHNLEQHKPVNGVNLFIIGSSGRGEVEVNEKDPDTIFAREAYGFGVLEATEHDLTIRILGEDDKEMHVATFHK
jgi:tartrate-resistant acid phosphatase type 5